MGFGLLLSSATFNDLERRIALILHHFSEFTGFAGQLLTVVEDRPIMLLQIIISGLHLAKTDPRSSCMVSLRQLSFFSLSLQSH